MAQFWRNERKWWWHHHGKNNGGKTTNKYKKKLSKQKFLNLFKELSCKSSTVSLFQVIDEDLLQALKRYCQGDKESNFVKGLKHIKLQTKLRNQYPVFTKIFMDIRKQSSGMLFPCVGELLGNIVQHTLDFYKSLPDYNEEDFEPRQEEVFSEVYPQWKIIFDKANYAKTARSQDSKVWDKLCRKCFPTHQALTPGLFIVTCACPRKAIYGFTMRLKHESPGMIFDLTMTRFPKTWNLTWVYDAACKAREYGLNRYPKRYCKTMFVSDPFHEVNHTTCSKSHMSSLYPTLVDKNREAAEQFNAILRDIGSGVSYMDPSLYMRSITIFCAWNNYFASFDK